MSDNVTKAIAGALDDHAALERHVNRWTYALCGTIFNGVVSHIGEKLFVSEELRIRAAAMSNELAVEFVDEFLPKQLSRMAKGADVSRTACAGALTQKFLGEVSEMYIKACVSALTPQIKKRIEAQDRAYASQLSGAYVEPSVDLGAMARDRIAQHIVDDSRKAVPASPAPSAFLDPDSDVGMVQRAGEATLAQAYSPHEKGPAPSAARLQEALAKSDTALDLAGGGKYPAKRKGR